MRKLIILAALLISTPALASSYCPGVGEISGIESILLPGICGLLQTAPDKPKQPAKKSWEGFDPNAPARVAGPDGIVPPPVAGKLQIAWKGFTLIGDAASIDVVKRLIEAEASACSK